MRFLALFVMMVLVTVPNAQAWGQHRESRDRSHHPHPQLGRNGWQTYRCYEYRCRPRPGFIESLIGRRPRTEISFQLSSIYYERGVDSLHTLPEPSERWSAPPEDRPLITIKNTGVRTRAYIFQGNQRVKILEPLGKAEIPPTDAEHRYWAAIEVADKGYVSYCLADITTTGSSWKVVSRTTCERVLLTER